MKSRAAALVGQINIRDIPHRKGWKPSDTAGRVPTTTHLRAETDELDEALIDLEITRKLGLMRNYPAEHAHASEEVADVFACILQIAYRLGMTFDDLDAEAERKLRLRFIGADAIELTA